MPLELEPAPAAGAGGLLFCEYRNAVVDERHEMRLHCAHFVPLPVGGNNDYYYNDTGPVVPTEASHLATFAALGERWRAYYSAAWTLSLVSVWYNSGGVLTRLPVTPTVAPIVGIAAEESGTEALRRCLILRSTRRQRRRLYLVQVAGGIVDHTVDVWPSSGGIDERDQALLAYLSSDDTGLVAPDGARFRPAASVRVWWTRRAVPDTDKGEAGPQGEPGTPGDRGPIGPAGPPASTGVDTGGHLSTDCLAFPHEARICNPADGTLTEQPGSSSELHTLTTHARTWPAGHVIEEIGETEGLARPMLAPDVEGEWDSTGVLLSGEYDIGYAWRTADHETGLSPLGTAILGDSFGNGWRIAAVRGSSPPSGTIGVGWFIAAFRPPRTFITANGAFAPDDPVTIPPTNVLPDAGFEGTAHAWSFASASALIRYDSGLVDGYCANGEGVQAAWLQSGGYVEQTFTCPAGYYHVQVAQGFGRTSSDYGWAFVQVDDQDVCQVSVSTSWMQTFTSGLIYLDASAHRIRVTNTFRDEHGTFIPGGSVCLIDAVSLVPHPDIQLGFVIQTTPSESVALLRGFGNGDFPTPLAEDGGIPAVPATVTFKHAAGASEFRQRGDQAQVWAAGAEQVRAPLPVLGSTPLLLAGKDPVTGLLAYFEYDLTRVLTEAPPDDDAPTEDMVLCGMARFLAEKLRAGYSYVLNGVTSALSLYAADISFGWTSINEIVLIFLPEISVETALLGGLASADTAREVAAYNASLCQLTPGQIEEGIVGSIYCAIKETTHTGTLDATTIAKIKEYIEAYTHWFSDVNGAPYQIKILESQLNVIPLERWAAWAETGKGQAQNTCGAFGCGLGE